MLSSWTDGIEPDDACSTRESFAMPGGVSDDFRRGRSAKNDITAR